MPAGRLLAFGLFAVAIIAYGILPYAVAHRETYPPRVPLDTTPAALGWSYEDVTFPGAGVELRGWLIPGRSPRTVVLVHAHTSNRWQMIDHARGLRDRGFSLLLYDQRGHGESGGDSTSFGYCEADDLLAAVTYLRSRPDTAMASIGALGLSLGAAAVVGAAARSDDVRAVVADSLFAAAAEVTDARLESRSVLLPYFGRLTELHAERLGGFSVETLRPIDAIGRSVSPRPLLLIQGGRDATLPPDNLDRLFHAALPPKRHWLVPSATHGRARWVDPIEYDRRVGDFFVRALVEEGERKREYGDLD